MSKHISCQHVIRDHSILDTGFKKCFPHAVLPRDMTVVLWFFALCGRHILSCSWKNAVQVAVCCGRRSRRRELVLAVGVCCGEFTLRAV